MKRQELALFPGNPLEAARDNEAQETSAVPELVLLDLLE
ncbi:MAG: hypothetical protein H6P95_1756, partial [Candidatus Aminicenantes bacterium]|nr:hypothetical protein [Candidatus Aminicenantes bacterium]